MVGHSGTLLLQFYERLFEYANLYVSTYALIYVLVGTAEVWGMYEFMSYDLFYGDA